MWSRLLNAAVVEIEVAPRATTPLLIKAGREPLDPTRADMAFELLPQNTPEGVREVPSVPGSSLRGALRNAAEELLLALEAEVCDLTEVQNSCSRGQDPRGMDVRQIWRRSCPICRLFGSTWLRSRFQCGDLLPDGATLARLDELFVLRSGVGLERKSQAPVKGAKFTQEVLLRDTAQEAPFHFKGTLTLLNFRTWELGLVCKLLNDLDDGLIRLGHGKSRGLGAVELLSMPRLTVYQQPFLGEGLAGVDHDPFWSELEGSLQDPPIPFTAEDREVPPLFPGMSGRVLCESTFGVVLGTWKRGVPHAMAR
jgi:CRISPR/Cas system CSM-associated protein Csm3 (group 7 of RAMP superfamily)